MMECDGTVLQETRSKAEKIINGPGWVATQYLPQGRCMVAEIRGGPDANANLIDDEWFEVPKGNRFPIVKIQTPAPQKPEIPKQILKRFATHSIVEILSAEKHEKDEKVFVIGNVPFYRVFVCGEVKGVAEENGRICLEIDDGTGQITCLVDKPKPDEKVPFDFMKFHDEMLEIAKNNTEDKIVKMCSTLNFITKKIYCSANPKFDRTLLGKMLYVRGNLREFNNRRVIFPFGIKIVDNDYFFKTNLKLVQATQLKPHEAHLIGNQ